MRQWQPYSRSPPSPPTRCCPCTSLTRHGTLSAVSLWRPNTGRVPRSCSDIPSPRFCVETCLVSKPKPQTSTVASTVSVASMNLIHDRKPNMEVARMSVLHSLTLCHADALKRSQCRLTNSKNRQFVNCNASKTSVSTSSYKSHHQGETEHRWSIWRAADAQKLQHHQVMSWQCPPWWLHLFVGQLWKMSGSPKVFEF